MHKNPQNINAFLFEQGCSEDLRSLLTFISRAGKYVAHAIKTGDLGKAGTSNLYGEQQLTLDVLADEIFGEHLVESNLVSCFASEEQEELVTILGDSGKFSVAFDPLDGSSLVDTNVTIGSIFGVWEGNGFLGRKGSEMKAAGYFTYGPRTTLVLSLGSIVDEFVLNDIGEFQIFRNNLSVQPYSKTFSPGNLRAVPERSEYARLLEHWISDTKTLRYTGGMVPDINSVLCKGNGIFTYPSHSQYPEGKLRLLYECAPMAFIVTCAGGKATNEKGQPILDIPCRNLHDRSSIFLGSTEEVNNALQFFSPQEPE
ncbi:MAG: class 1 fructose-bisphosphatase [Candidatus Peregrinibacteria bacterium]